MICAECHDGNHGECKTSQRWGQPTGTGLPPRSRATQRNSWCYCQHRTTTREDWRPTLDDAAVIRTSTMCGCGDMARIGDNGQFHPHVSSKTGQPCTFRFEYADGHGKQLEQPPMPGV